MKLIIKNPQRKSLEDLFKIAKRLYTEQRGRVTSNTKSWDELSEDQRLDIVDDVECLMEDMEASWQVSS